MIYRPPSAKTHHSVEATPLKLDQGKVAVVELEAGTLTVQVGPQMYQLTRPGDTLTVIQKLADTTLTAPTGARVAVSYYR